MTPRPIGPLRGRAVGLALLLLVVGAGGVARAEDPALPGLLVRDAKSPYPLAPARYIEVHVSTSLQLDWNGRTDRPADAGVARASFLGGVEVAGAFANQRLRPGIFVGLQGGHWGDDRHGPFSIVPGFRFRGSFFMEDVFDVYGLLRADLPITLSTSAGVGFRGGFGVGVRVARLVSLEASFDPLVVPISQTFQNSTYATVLPWAATGTIAFDLCIIDGLKCKPAEHKPRARNLACRLYDAARAITNACDAVPRAMQSVPDPHVAARSDDGVTAFLSALADATGRPDVRDLAKLHARLGDQYESYLRREAAYAQEHLELAERWTYAPVPSELRRALGCDGAIVTDCVELEDAK